MKMRKTRNGELYQKPLVMRNKGFSTALCVALVRLVYSPAFTMYLHSNKGITTSIALYMVQAQHTLHTYIMHAC